MIMTLTLMIGLPSNLVFAFPHFIHIGFLLACINLSLYFMGCVLAVYFFVRNLSKLTKARATSIRDVTITSARQIELDPQQTKLSDVSSNIACYSGLRCHQHCYCGV